MVLLGIRLHLAAAVHVARRQDLAGDARGSALGDRSPAEIIRDHVRFTLQPVDAPPDPTQSSRIIEQIGSDDILLFSTDYPHWQFDGDDALPAGLSASLLRRLLVDNPLATYPRLKETLQ